MRLLPLTLFLVLVCSIGFAQVFRIDSLPPQGVLLDKGWKFHAGDNPDFAKPDFDDSKWESIDPTKDIMDLPQLDKQTGRIGWFRLHLAVKSVLHQQLVLQIVQSGASEMYLNGRLIHRLGMLSNNPDKIKAFSPLERPISFPVNTDSVQVLAIRYTLQPGILYATHFGNQNPGLIIKLNTTENGVANYRDNIYQDRGSLIESGVFGILAVLFFSLFLFFPSRKVNLYFSIYAFLLAFTWLLFPQQHEPCAIEGITLGLNTILGFQAIGYLFMLTSVYLILEQKHDWFYWSLVALGIICIPCAAFIYGWGWFIFGFLFTNLINIDITRVAVLASRKNKKGAWIIVLGGVCFLISWIIFCLAFANIYNLDIGINFFEISILSIPVAFAIFLGYDTALTNRVLQQKLIEVENLSTEKQQILATQNETLEKQVKERTAELKASQNQLIQKEKLASLGELTAGIAHEIQNPLNFVNNFSEVSAELVVEMQDELDRGDTHEAKAIADDIKQNLQKINLHGQRASSIVKGMLEHSRTATGEKRPTDLNALADEYLRLSYQGMRAKNKDVTVTLQTDFAADLGPIDVVPQDMGRVLLNLFNNAFYAVHEKQKTAPHDYQPTVSVSTTQANGLVEIRVRDNGMGIPNAIKEKIFQPFFTTKPTGEGTGLGLSLSYDIVTKGHGGTLTVETVEGEGTTFVIKLPLI